MIFLMFRLNRLSLILLTLLLLVFVLAILTLLMLMALNPVFLLITLTILFWALSNGLWRIVYFLKWALIPVLRIVYRRIGFQETRRLSRRSYALQSSWSWSFSPWSLSSWSPWCSSWRSSSFSPFAYRLQDVMLCRRPYMLGVLPCPCGGCLPCRINRRRVWAHRILLESYKHGDSCFVTLTYDDDHVPAVLVRAHYQAWLKRLRRAVFPRKIRYFLAGEYGETTGRPHYHAAVFGLDRLTAGGLDGQGGAVQSAWISGRSDPSSLGFTSVGELTWESAQYIAGYLTKKVQNDDAAKGFSRMSLRPGIGAWAMDDVAKSLSSDVGLDSVLASSDVPSMLQHGKRMLPLGRYLRRVLRGKLGFASKDTPPEAARLFALQKAAEMVEERSQLSNSRTPWEVYKLMLDTRLQKIKNMESRFALRDSERKLI